MNLQEAKKTNNPNKPKFLGRPSVKNSVVVDGRHTNILYTNLPINASEGQSFKIITRQSAAKKIFVIPQRSGVASEAETTILIKRSTGIIAAFATSTAPERHTTSRQGLSFWSSSPWIYIGSRTEKDSKWFYEAEKDLTLNVTNDREDPTAAANLTVLEISHEQRRNISEHINAWLTLLDEAKGGDEFTQYLKNAETAFANKREDDGTYLFTPRLLNLSGTELAGMSPNEQKQLFAGSPLTFFMNSEGRISFKMAYPGAGAGEDAVNNFYHFDLIGKHFNKHEFATTMVSKCTTNRKGFIELRDLANHGAPGAAIVSEIRQALQRVENNDSPAIRVALMKELDINEGDITRRLQDEAFANERLYAAATTMLSPDASRAYYGLVKDVGGAYAGQSINRKINELQDPLSIDKLADAPKWRGVVLRSPTGDKKIFLFPPNTDAGTQRGLLQELMIDYSGWTDTNGKTNPVDIKIENFTPSSWALMRSNIGGVTKLGGADKIPPGSITLKLARKTIGNAEYIGAGFTSAGTLDFVHNDQLTPQAEKLLRRLRDYNAGVGSLNDAQELAAVFPKTSPLFSTPDSKIRRVANTANILKTPSAEDPKFLRYEQSMKGVVAALKQGAAIHGFGAVLQEAFPQGLVIRGRGVAGLYMFDGAGQLYRVDKDNPEDQRSWKHVPAQLFSHDSEYLRVMKHLGALAKAEYGGTYLKTGDIETFANQSDKMGTRELFKHPSERAAFLKWHDALMIKIAAVLDSKESPIRKNAEALVAFPTMDFVTSSVRDESSEEDFVSALTAAAIRRDDEKAQEILASMVGPGIESRGLAMEGFTRFQKWVHASYMLDQMGRDKGQTFLIGTHLGALPLTDAERVLQDHLVQQINRVKELQKGVFSSMMTNMPAEIKKDRSQFADDNLMGKIGNRLFEHIIDPVYNWIRMEWDYLMALAGRVSDIWKDPSKYIKSLTPKLLDAAYESLKLFFRKAAGAAIDTVFADEERATMKPDGSIRAYSFSKVRQGAYDFMENALHTRPLTVNEQELMTRLASTKSADERREDRHGKIFRGYFEPRTAEENRDLLKQATDNSPHGIEYKAPLTPKGKNPKATIKVVVNISNLAAANLTHGGLMDELRYAPPTGWVITTDGSQKHVAANASDTLTSWWLSVGRKLKPYKFVAASPADNMPDGEPVEPRTVKIRMDRNNVAQLEMEYSLRDMFGHKYSDVYYRMYGRKLTSAKTPTLSPESDRGGKMNLIERLFFAGLKGV